MGCFLWANALHGWPHLLLRTRSYEAGTEEKLETERLGNLLRITQLPSGTTDSQSLRTQPLRCDSYHWLRPWSTPGNFISVLHKLSDLILIATIPWGLYYLHCYRWRNWSSEKLRTCSRTQSCESQRLTKSGHKLFGMTQRPEASSPSLWIWAGLSLLCSIIEDAE